MSTDNSLSSIFKKMPMTILSQNIMPYAARPQPPELLRDIRSFHMDMNIIDNIYHTQFNDVVFYTDLMYFVNNRSLSASETNPNIYVDMGSSKIITHIGLYKHSNDTTTQVKIQHSNDALTWSDLKTITSSNITAGTWEYDRFNVCYARYIRVYSTDVTNKVMAYSQIKIKTIVDGELSNHGHLQIDPSDSSLGHDGTSA